MSDQFPLISGYPSIDLVNTEVVRRGIRHDLLESESDLKNWLTTIQATGNLTGIQIDDKRGSETLCFVREIRTLLRSGFEKIADQQPLEDNWHLYLEKIIEEAPFSYKIVQGSLVPIPMGAPTLAMASVVAYNALQLLASKALFKLHRCSNPDCVLLFLDESGRRKWCSMKICGNRTKVARHHSLHGNR